ncbi:MAG: ABC transporter substrate-binding protein [Synergistaceae bacterium]|jgi:peptide/nickel transport system substrate-binding protein|nr:ABC transporter substrate-binding protein [Synergistaceae bacterium]
MKRIKILSFILTLVLVCSALTACGASGPASAKKDTLTVGTASDSKSLDPAIAVDVHSSTVYSQIYETLLALDTKKNLIPKLAEYKQLDDLNYEFYIKQGVKFHNGEELKASDVVFTIKRGIETPLLQYIFDVVDPASVVAKDDYTVALKLASPSASFLSSLTSNSASVVSEKAVSEGGENYGMNPVGTGPMKFVKWEKNVSIEIERNDDYYGQKPELKKIIFKPIIEATNRTIELETGGIDVAVDIPPTDYTRVAENADLRLATETGYSIRYVGFNLSKPPFDNEKVRQAISHAIDAEGITLSIRSKNEEVTNAPYSSAMMFYDRNIEHATYDPALAKQLLAEAGYPKGFTTTIIADERKERVDIATIVQQQLAEIGVTADIKVMEWGTFLNATYGGDTELYVMGWSSAIPDPDYVVYSVFHSSMMGEGGNMSFVNDPRVDALVERGRTTSNFDERGQIYSELQALLKELSPWVYLWTETLFVGVSDSIDYIELHPSAVYPFYKVTFK